MNKIHQEKEDNKHYELRQVSLDDAEEATAVEAVCFSPSEACTLPIMKERISRAADTFLTAIDRETGKMVGFVNGLCTNESSLRDELVHPQLSVNRIEIQVLK